MSGPWEPGVLLRTQAAPLLVGFFFFFLLVSSGTALLLRWASKLSGFFVLFLFLFFACYLRSSTHAWCLFVFTPNQNLIPRALIHLTFISSTQVLKPTTSESDAQGLVF